MATYWLKLGSPWQVIATHLLKLGVHNTDVLVQDVS